jgi:hypothetical protein
VRRSSAAWTSAVAVAGGWSVAVAEGTSSDGQAARAGAVPASSAGGARPMRAGGAGEWRRRSPSEQGWHGRAESVPRACDAHMSGLGMCP